MPRPANPRASGTPRALRIPDELYEAIVAEAGSPSGFAAWMRMAAEEHLRKGQGQGQGLQASERSSGRSSGYDEGWRAGWAAANTTFREGLRIALDKLDQATTRRVP